MSLAPAIRLGLSAQLAFGLAVGVAAGLVYFGLLWRNATLFAQGRAAAAALVQATRFVALAAVLYAMARLGAAALLSALTGVVLARELVRRRLGKAP